MADNSFFIPAGYGEAELVEKRSRFIGRVWPVDSEDEALERLRETREQHWDARHNVYAYIIRENGIMRYSDDGEPGGTSGMPTLEVFRSEGVMNFCCVITRYFGGTLLGTGGLRRAYSQTAKLALEAAGKAVVRRWSSLELPCPYSLFERVRTELEAAGGTAEDTEYGAEVLIRALIPEQDAERFVSRIVDLSAGTMSPRIIGVTERAVKL